MGTNPIQTDIVDIADKTNLCVLVGIGQQSTQAIFDQLVSASERTVNAQQKDILYQEFKAERADLALDKEIEKLSAQ